MAKVLDVNFDSTVSSVFPVPVFSASLSPESLKEVQKEVGGAVKKIIAKEDMTNPWKGESISGSSFKYTHNPLKDRTLERSNIKKYEMKLLERYIFRSIHQYCSAVGVNVLSAKIEIVDSWINIHTKRDFMDNHIHPCYDISGTYYYKAPKNCGGISFTTPISTVEFGSFPGMGMSSFSIEPYEGLLLLFPSWLRHQVKLNESDEERICVAFNIKLNTQS